MVSDPIVKPSRPESKVPENLLSQLSEYVNDNMGLHFPKARWHTLSRNMAAVARELAESPEQADTVGCIHRLLSSPLQEKEMEILARHLTIGETYFLRDRNLFETLEKRILPELIQAHNKDKKLRFWSAGCATGEEPYSLAILIDKMLPVHGMWDIEILGTDINTSFLEKAREGIYTTWSFREIPPPIFQKYFTEVGEKRFLIHERIRKMVSFQRFNLAEGGHLPSAVRETDLIFCRNVLMYFNRDLRKKVIGDFAKALSEKGWFILSAGENGFVQHPELSPIFFSGVLCYRKQTGPEPAPVKNKWREKVEILKKASRRIREKTPPSDDRSDKARKAPFSEAAALFSEKKYEKTVKNLLNLLDDSGTPLPIKERGKGMILLARSLANLGNTEEAGKWCGKALKIDKVDPGAHYLMATIHQECGQFDQARESLRRALFIDPDFVLAHFALGNLTMQQGRLNEGERHFRNAADLLEKLDPEIVLPHGEGISAGRLSKIISSMKAKEEAR